jgi:hypothetical protein
MLTLKSFAMCNRSVGFVSALMLFSIGLFYSPVKAQTDDEGVPPWQRPPKHVSHARSGAIEKTAYNRTTESTSEGEVINKRSGSAYTPHVPSELESGNFVDNEESERNIWSDDECLDCGYENCLNPFANRLWVRGEFLAMWGKSANVPPLVTTSNAADAGVLGRSSTQILFGGRFEDPGIYPGGRLTVGYKCNPCEDTGLEASYMFLSNKGVTLSADSTTTPIIARPFFNVQTPGQDAVIIALPNSDPSLNQTGSINASLTNEFYSLEMLWRQGMQTQCGRQLNFLAGYRYGNFNEILAINSSTQFLGATTQISDRFSAENVFHGAELGISTKKRYCRWTVELLGKFALGNTRSTLDMRGSTIISTGTTTQSGLLAPPVNISHIEENNFTVIPELGITLGYDLTDRLRASLGYTFLYWSRVARPSDQIDMNVNVGNVSTSPPAPMFRYVPGDYWVQGCTAGLEFRF